MESVSANSGLSFIAAFINNCSPSLNFLRVLFTTGGRSLDLCKTTCSHKGIQILRKWKIAQTPDWITVARVLTFITSGRTAILGDDSCCVFSIEKQKLFILVFLDQAYGLLMVSLTLAYSYTLNTLNLFILFALVQVTKHTKLFWFSVDSSWAAEKSYFH